MIKGIAASSGISIGHALVLEEKTIEIAKTQIEDVEAEIKRFRSAIDTAGNQLREIRNIAEINLGRDKALIFDSHILMLSDPELIGAVETEIRNNGINSEYALNKVFDGFISIFEQMDNEYMRERAADIKDVGKRIRNILLGIENTSLSVLKDECIIVAKDLTPSDTAQMDREKVIGFVTDVGGSTSHSAIMARSLEIPAVVGAGIVSTLIKKGDLLIIDGDSGSIIINPEDAILREFEEKRRKLISYRNELALLKDLEAITKDGKKVEVSGNIGNLKDIERVLGNGGQGVGLFRTEFLYMDRNSLPDEETQFKVYKEAAEKLGGRPLIIRTLDIGGDKKLPYLSIPEESNPFLGYRAIRLCLNEESIFRTQLKALLRASHYGNIKIMFPMISNIGELRAAKGLLYKAKEELRESNVLFNEDMEVGIMIEIPSAAIISDILAREVDFFSIGTNDLIQYTIAVDRMNEKVSYLYEPYHPGILRLIKTVIDNGHREGKWVGMCGEMAGDPMLIPILLGFGLDEFSMSATSILKAKKQIRVSRFNELKKQVEKILLAGSAEEVKEIIKNMNI